MRKVIVNVVALGYCFGCGAQVLEPSYYQLPEGIYPTQERVKSLSIEDQLQLHVDILERSQLTNQSSNVEWTVNNVDLRLGLTLGGLIGVLAVKGTAASQIHWRPVGKRQLEEKPGTEIAVLGNQVQSHLEALVTLAKKTGQVKDESKLRTQLNERLNEIRELVLGVDWTESPKWRLNKLAFDFTIGVSGTVHPGVTVGGGLRFRFVYNRLNSSSVQPTVLTDKQSSLQSLLQTVAEALRKAPLQPPVAGMPLKKMRFTLAVSAKGDIGIGTGSISVVGHAFYERHNEVVTLPQLPMSDAYITILSDADSKREQVAKSLGVRTRLVTLADGSAGREFKLPVQLFINGLKKASRLSNWMVSKASQARGEKWELYEVKTDFALSVGGNVGLASVTGAGTIRFVQKK